MFGKLLVAYLSLHSIMGFVALLALIMSSSVTEEDMADDM